MLKSVKITRRDILKARDTLESVRILGSIAERRSNDLEIAKAKIEKMTANIDDVRVMGGKPDDGSKIDDLIRTRSRYEEADKDYRDRRDYVLTLIDSMQKVEEAEVLYQKYCIDPEPTWIELANSLSYSERNIYRLEDRAVVNFAKLMQEKPLKSKSG